jgi:hypothetical protein
MAATRSLINGQSATGPTLFVIPKKQYQELGGSEYVELSAILIATAIAAIT